MPKAVLVTGANGQVGSELHSIVQNNRFDEFSFYFTDKESLGITNKAEVKKFCKDNKIKVIINCAAYTAVDKAEDDRQNADLINNVAVESLSQIAKEKTIQMIHISTDYVFDGTNCKPYVEEDEENPTSVYGRTKLDGEKAMCSVAPENSLILRTSWVYSSFGSNFVKTMLRLGKEQDELGVIFDQIGTPTYARDLAKSILHILTSGYKNKRVEIYHYSNEGVCSWYDFAKAIFDFSDIPCRLNPISTEQYPTPAKRPHYTLLDKSKIKDRFMLDIPYWRDSLQECLKVV